MGRIIKRSFGLICPAGHYKDNYLHGKRRPPGSLAVQGHVRKNRPRLAHSLQVNRPLQAADVVHVCRERRRRRLDMYMSHELFLSWADPQTLITIVVWYMVCPKVCTM
jgi:hypothetical protein